MKSDHFLTVAKECFVVFIHFIIKLLKFNFSRVSDRKGHYTTSNAFKSISALLHPLFIFDCFYHYVVFLI